jgi:N-acetylglutamate synthase-like GNAT family acetyltransferase
MKIIDLAPEHEALFFCCLEEWSEDMKEAGDAKQKWYHKMRDLGLRVKLARDDNNVIGGMIQYLPIEYSMFKGENLYVVLCIWVHGHKQGRGNFQKRGMGRALLQAAEEESKKMGAKGLVTWGLMIPVFMRASWFKRQGYKVVDKSGMMRLLWKPFTADAVAPGFIKREKKPEKGIDKVNVSIFRSGWCQAQNMSFERAKRVAGDFEGKVNVKEYDTIDAPAGYVQEFGGDWPL